MSDDDKDKIIEDLQSEITMLKSILYQMPGNIYWKSKDDRILGCNVNNAKLLGKTPEELAGKFGYELLPSEIAEEVRLADQKIVEAKKEVSFEEKGIDGEGKHSIYLSRKTPLFDARGDVLGILGISVDITKQKQAEEKLKAARKKAEAASKAKSQFLAMISHEIRTPLTSMLGFANFLEKEQLSLDDQKNYLRYVIQSGNYLLSLINKLLDYSKLEADKAELEPVAFNLKKLVEGVNGMLAVSAKDKELELKLEYDANIPETVVADTGILRQILINLIGNAIKFTHTGKITVIVKVLEQNATHVKLDFSVQDTGIGIPADKLKSIFKEFYQVEDIYTRSNSMTGTGLGLAIVKKLVKLFQGTLRVKSVMNQGSIFSFNVTLPLEQKALRDNAKPTPGLNEDVALPIKIRVMLVEDDKMVQIIHQRMLANIGCHVDIVENGKAALVMMVKHDYAMVFVDIGLPDINGFDLIKAMKKIPSAKQIPIIALTGFFTDEEREKCLRAGADQVIVKPVSQAVLKDVVCRCVTVNTN